LTSLGLHPHDWLGDRSARGESLRAIGASIGVHLLLVLALVVSLHWSTEPTEPVQAELWSSLPPEKPAARPTPKTEPEPEPPKPAQPDPEAAEAELALAKKKKAQAEREQAERDLAAKEKALREKALKEKTAKEKADKEKAAKEKAAAQQEQASAKRLAQQREAELARLGLDAKAKPQAKGKDSETKAGVANGAAQGARSGREAEWMDKVRAAIRGRVLYKGADTSDLSLVIRFLPTGEITRVLKKTGSNAPAYDAAVLRALEELQTLPKPPDGVREITIYLRHRN